VHSLCMGVGVHTVLLAFTQLSGVTEGFKLCWRTGQKLTLKPSFLAEGQGHSKLLFQKLHSIPLLSFYFFITCVLFYLLYHLHDLIKKLTCGLLQLTHTIT